ncbi:MAG TPA: hypothetical protein VN616_01560 [Puia sp.]|nr:hypothetical protein [Puia sp.]
MPKSRPADGDEPGSGERETRPPANARDGRRQLIRYAGLASELAVAVGVSVWLGIEADKRLKLSFPVFSCAIPLLVIVVLLVQLIKANSGRK